ncbi:TPA: hypothetical protein ACF355_003338 [Escherichia coli]
MSDNPDRKQPDNHSVPCIRGHLLQDGCLFQLQTSRDDIRAAFTEEEARWLEQAFPLILQQMVTMAAPRLTGDTDAACLSPQRADL